MILQGQLTNAFQIVLYIKIKFFIKTKFIKKMNDLKYIHFNRIK